MKKKTRWYKENFHFSVLTLINTNSRIYLLGMGKWAVIFKNLQGIKYGCFNLCFLVLYCCNDIVILQAFQEVCLNGGNTVTRR